MAPSGCWSRRGGKNNQAGKRYAYAKAAANGFEDSVTKDQTSVLLAGDKLYSTNPPSFTNPSYVTSGEDELLEVYGYERSSVWTLAIWVLIILTGGVLRLVFHWWPELMLWSTHRRCALPDASKVLVVEMFQKKYKRYYVRDITTITLEAAQRKMQPPAPTSMPETPIAERGAVDMDAPTRLLVPTNGGNFIETESFKTFTCKKMRYVWDPQLLEYRKVRGWDFGVSTSHFHEQTGLSTWQQWSRRVVYGTNLIVVPVKSIMQLLVLEVLNPFYIFQVFSVILWFNIEYYYYAGVIIFMSASGVISAIIQTRRNQQKLRSTVHGSDVITILRGGGVQEAVSTADLVPGDVLVLPPKGCMMHCDAVLLSGNCIVNEAMLTGESVPVTKTPLPNRPDLLYDVKEHSRHTLYCGTQVVQTRYYGDDLVLAVVVRTGFLTAKGGLVASIMYPPPVDFRFERDSYRFVGALASIASVGLVYTMAVQLIHGETGKNVALHSLDLVTIAVPPALPAAMTMGIMVAQARLKKLQIYCISPRTINVSGSINCVCFDKTGTLTEDGLDMWGVVPVKDKRCLPPLRDPQKLPSLKLSGEGKIPLLAMAMATCHSLTLIENKLSGDPLDQKMFESTGWTLEEPSSEDNSKYDLVAPTVVKYRQSSGHGVAAASLTELHQLENPDSNPLEVTVGIVRQFPFTSALQRMSVICKQPGQTRYDFFAKGSPEMITSLADTSSIPDNFFHVLQQYTQQGYRVIALAYRSLEFSSFLKVQRAQREDLERDLQLLGLVVLENRLKEDTPGVIGQLMDAKVRCIMVTGDNLLTAISVARDCGMVGAEHQVVLLQSDALGDTPTLSYTLAEQPHLPEAGDGQGAGHVYLEMDAAAPKDTPFHLAVTGKTWSVIREHFPEMIPRVVVKGTVFARMSPDQKQQLVQELQQLSYSVGMCGDGANDCGALKAAHAGISLSETEASVASPFTSREPTIACVPQLIRQGRSALVTSFGIFKYMAAYSLTQFISVMLLYDIGTNLTDFEFLYIDLFLITIFAFVMGRNEPHPGPLVPQPPMTSLVALPPLLSLFFQLVLVVLTQGLSLVSLKSQPWYVPYNTTGKHFLEPPLACEENYTVFSVSMFQYIVLAVAFSKGFPYRKPFYTNHVFLGSILVMTAVSAVVVASPPPFLVAQLELQVPESMDFRGLLLGIAAIYALLAFFCEEFITDRWLVRFLNSPWYLSKRPPKDKYLEVEKQIASSRWPPLHVEAQGTSDETKIPKWEGGLHTGSVTLDPAQLDGK